MANNQTFAYKDSTGREIIIKLPEHSTLDVAIGQAIAPMLLYAGFSRESISELFKDGDPATWDSIWNDLHENRIAP